MDSVCLYFQVHQPNRLQPYDFFRIGENAFYEDDKLNGEVLRKVARKCYLPATELLLRAIEESKGKFKCSFSLSGVFLEQCEHHSPEVIEAFQRLVGTGNVEILGETYYHSLASSYSPDEFARQVELHRLKVKELFGVEPRVFRNTELIYSNAVAAQVERAGFQGVLAEGIDEFLRGEETGQVFRPPGLKSVKVLLRNSELSDDLGFRFSDKNWTGYPLRPATFVRKIRGKKEGVATIFLDFETIGEHHWADTGIFDFYDGFIKRACAVDLKFVTPSKIIEDSESCPIYDCYKDTSWADQERDLSAWKGNVMQQEAFSKVARLEQRILAINDLDLLHSWGKLQTSDHFYYMATKQGSDQEVHDYFSPYPSPYDAYIFFMNAVADLAIRVQRLEESRK